MRKIQKTAIVGGAVATLMAGGVAFAAWTSTGSGAGQVTAGSETGITVTSTDATDLYPGLTATIDVTVTNNNAYAVKLDTLAYNSAAPASVGAPGSFTDTEGCDVSNVSVDDLNFVAGEIVPAGETSDPYTATVTMDDDAAPECQGAVFTLNFDASADSNVTAP